ncbi:MAG: hypothetical protein CSB15_00035 [Clostridiales bacterium]|nr:MAG: hypothetical protein CSB15_00035 [Clostridiales bacterium]
MINFYGEFQHKIENGRISFPAKYRHQINGCIYITRDDDAVYPHLVVYPEPEWELLVNNLNKISSRFDKKATKYIRNLQRYADKCSIDKQGRIILDDKLFEFCKSGLEEKKKSNGNDKSEETLVFVGIGNKIEIWHPDVLAEYDNNFEEEVYDINDYVKELDGKYNGVV